MYSLEFVARAKRRWTSKSRERGNNKPAKLMKQNLPPFEKSLSLHEVLITIALWFFVKRNYRRYVISL